VYQPQKCRMLLEREES